MILRIKTKPSEIYKEVQDGINFNTQIDLYETVKRNENFYNDKQWIGVNAPDLDKPVFNFLKPVVNYYISMLVSDDITANIEISREGVPVKDNLITKILSSVIHDILEDTNAAYKHRELLRNMAVDGDMVLYSYFDPSMETGMTYKGGIKTEIIPNTQIYFGNPIEQDVQEQPYVILAQRKLTASVKWEAEKLGIDPDVITADSAESTLDFYETDKSYTTVYYKFYKKDGTVHYTKCTRDAVLKEETNLGYTRYPISYGSWERRRDSFHGISPITGKIPNQIFVNKLYAMAMEYTKKMAFPKLLYNATKIKHWSNKIGEAVAVSGDPREALFANFQTADMSNQVMNLINATITQTKEMMGAYDAALGNVKPDNTSAIIAVQKAASQPLDVQRMDFYQFVEDTVRNWIDIIATDYGIRTETITENGETFTITADFSQLKEYRYKLSIDIGPSAYWSELLQIQTLDNLLQNHIIPDALTYLESIPDGYIKGKANIEKKIKELQEENLLKEQSQRTVQNGGELYAMPPM